MTDTATTEMSTTIVERAIGEFNAGKTEGPELSTDPSTPLLSADSAIDSLALVSIFIGIEQIADDDFDTPITVVDESAFKSEAHPFRTVGSLVAHVDRLLQRA